MANVVSDTFTDTAGTLLSAHAGETGATWMLHPSYSGTAKISDANRLRAVSTTSFAYYASGVPGSADYDVQAIIRVVSGLGLMGVCGRMDPTANTFYMARYEKATNVWTLYKFVAGTPTQLSSSWAETVPLGEERTVKLEMRGTAIKLYVDGVVRVSVTDSAITAAGRAGVRGAGGTDDNVTALHLDTFTADTVAAPVNDVTPVVSGNTWVGQVLTITDGDGAEDWTGEDSIARQWQRETAVGSGVYADIAGQTGDTYTNDNADRTLRLRAKIVATNGSGSTEAFSAPVGPIGTATAIVMELETQFDLVGAWVVASGRASATAFLISSLLLED